MAGQASLKVFPLNLQVATDEYEQLVVMWTLARAKAQAAGDPPALGLQRQDKVFIGLPTESTSA